MPRDVIPFRAGSNRTTDPLDVRPNLAFASLELLERLARTLQRVIPFRDRCRAVERTMNSWGEPPPFFLSGASMSERTAQPKNWITDRCIAIAARRDPRGASDWAALGDLIDDAFTGCAASDEIRKASRAVPHLHERLKSLAADHRGCSELAALLDVADDCVLTVLHPGAGTGFRIRLMGLVDLDQLHVLLADAVAGSTKRGYLPGPRPDLRLVEAYLDQPTDPDCCIATARFQFLRPEALASNGALPSGFNGHRYWFWGHESPLSIPMIHGERVLLITDAVYPRQWIAHRRFPALNGRLELLNILSREHFETWIHRLTTGREVLPKDLPAIRKAA